MPRWLLGTRARQNPAKVRIAVAKVFTRGNNCDDQHRVTYLQPLSYFHPIITGG
jgi:hypothetical protein